MCTATVFFGCGSSSTGPSQQGHLYQIDGCWDRPNYKISFGDYIVDSAMIAMDTCQSGIVAASLDGTHAKWDDDNTQSTLTLSSASGYFLSDADHSTCNLFQAAYGPTNFTNGLCTWMTTRVNSLQIVGDDRFSVAVVDKRENPVGMCGVQPGSCMVIYQAYFHK